MGIVVDIILVGLIILGIIAGIKRGLIKSLVGLIGLVSVVIISYTLRVPIANFLIDKLPFLTYGGALTDLYALNIFI